MPAEVLAFPEAASRMPSLTCNSLHRRVRSHCAPTTALDGGPDETRGGPPDDGLQVAPRARGTPGADVQVHRVHRPQPHFRISGVGLTTGVSAVGHWAARCTNLRPPDV